MTTKKEAILQYAKSNPSLTQVDLAKEFEVTKGYISNTLKLERLNTLEVRIKETITWIDALIKSIQLGSLKENNILMLKEIQGKLEI